MCGIAGFFLAGGVCEDRAVIEGMAEKIAHRGPDAQGFYTGKKAHLASRRLSIIDLEAPPQPLISADGSTCIVFNGEIYNFPALRRELADLGHSFSTHTDTEVVLNAFRQWGKACLDRFQGMFAFAVWNEVSEELFVARDRMGIKPLYYTLLPDGTFVFGSEIKALLAHPRCPRQFYAPAMDNLLTYGFNVAPYTFFQDIYQLLPGHCAVVSGKGFFQKKYWDIDIKAPILDISLQDASLLLREKLERSVNKHLLSDVPVAAYLSGGIDSSAIAGIYSRLSAKPVTTISITFDQADYDEAHYARIVSRHFHTQHHEFRCTISGDQIEKLVYHLENPLVTLLNLPLYLLSQKTRQEGFKVVLSGDGADEIMGGYSYFRLLKAMRFIEAKQGKDAYINLLRTIFPQLQTLEQAGAHYRYFQSIGRTFPLQHPAFPYKYQEFQMKDQLYSDELKVSLAASPQANPLFFDLDDIAHRSFFDQALYIETKMRLLNLTLPLSDKMSMANSVELRPPLLDHELVNFLFTLPARYKMHGLDEKHVFKKSMRNFLPDSICARRKQPLTPPSKWFVDQAGDMLRDYLSEPRLLRSGFFNPAFIREALEKHDAGDPMDFSGVLVVAFFVELWGDLFLS